MANKLKVRKGDVFSRKVRWETKPFVYRPIVAILNSAPCRLNVPGHGLSSGRRFAIVSAKGLLELNAKNSPPDPKTDFRKATVVDQDWIELNEVNAIDFKPHEANSGYIQYLTPVDISGYDAVLYIKNRRGGDVLFTLTTADNPNGKIVIDTVERTVEFFLETPLTSQFDFSKAVFDLNMVAPVSGRNYTIYSGDLIVEKE